MFLCYYDIFILSFEFVTDCIRSNFIHTVVHRLGSNPTTTLFPKCTLAALWVFTEGGQSHKKPWV